MSNQKGSSLANQYSINNPQQKEAAGNTTNIF